MIVNVFSGNVFKDLAKVKDIMQSSILSGLAENAHKEPVAAYHTLARAQVKNGRKSTNGLAEPGARAKVLVEQHGTQAILAALKDEEELAKFSTYDAMLIMGIANSLKGNGDERERMFNRMFGKVPDKSINLNLNVDVSPEQLTTRADKLLDDLGDDSDLIEQE